VRRALLINLDFRDFVYSHQWGQAVLDGCVARGLAVDVVAVDPFARRNLAAELGVPDAAVAPRGAASVTYLERADAARECAVIDELLARGRYDTLIVNCDAPLFVHLMLRHSEGLGAARWLIYDRHLHIDLRAHDQDATLRARMVASRLQLFAIEEIVTGTGPRPGQRDSALSRQLAQLRNRLRAALGTRAPAWLADATDPPVERDHRLIASFRRLGLTAQTIHLQKWPLDDDYFAPQPTAPAAVPPVLFSGGDSGRDYATLFAAVQGLPLQLRLCAERPPAPRPDNVTVLPRLALHQFRDEVARASAVVVPLSGQPPVSGITVIAMARMMQRPVIATENAVVRMHIRWQGDGGFLTPPGDARALRARLERLLRHPAEAAGVAARGRAQAAQDLSLRGLVARMLDCDPYQMNPETNLTTET